MTKKKKKKTYGSLLAIMIFLFIVACGYTLGKIAAKAYNIKHNTNYTIYEFLTISDNTRKESSKEILDSDIKSIEELCGSSIGLCDKTVGTISLNNNKHKLYIYRDFDNAGTTSTYFKISDIRVGDFASLNNFTTLDGKYLVVTEPSQNDNYLIHFYNEEGKEIKNVIGTFNNGQLSEVENKLYYYYCDPNDLNEENNKALKYNSFSITNNKITIEETSKEYGKC